MARTLIETYNAQRYTAFQAKMLEVLGIYGPDEYPDKVVVGLMQNDEEIMAFPYAQSEGYGDAHTLIAVGMEYEMATYGDSVCPDNVLVGTASWRKRKTDQVSKCTVDLRNLPCVALEVNTILHTDDGEQRVKAALRRLAINLGCQFEIIGS